MDASTPKRKSSERMVGKVCTGMCASPEPDAMCKVSYMEQTKSFENWTRKEFEALPLINWDERIYCDRLVILPKQQKHDSGFRCMEFVAVQHGKPICRVSGCSDVIHIGGIGGYNRAFNKDISKPLKPIGWSIDCLPKSGLLCLFCDTVMFLGQALSSFEVFYEPVNKHH